MRERRLARPNSSSGRSHYCRECLVIGGVRLGRGGFDRDASGGGLGPPCGRHHGSLVGDDVYAAGTPKLPKQFKLSS